MTRVLKTSGFLGLAVQMLYGMQNAYLVMPGGPNLQSWMVGAHAHLGVLSILAIVVGFAVDHYDLQGRERSLVQWFYVVGQWAVPGSVIAAEGLSMPPLHSLAFVAGTLLFLAMADLTYRAATHEA